jgi:hypothetical protein
VSRWRIAVPVGLLLAGIVSAALVLTTDDPTWKAVWIGLTSTCLTAGLVDGSGLLEARRREHAVLRVVGHRVGFVHQRYLWIVRAAFDLHWNDGADVPNMLRALTTANIVDLRTGMPQLTPPTTRLAYAVGSLGELHDALAVAVSLASGTGEAHRLEAVDRALRLNTFDTWLRAAAASPQMAVVTGGHLANAAADVLTQSRSSFATSLSKPTTAGASASSA